MFFYIMLTLFALVQVASIIVHFMFRNSMMRLLANILKTEDVIHQVVEDHDQRIKKLESLI